MKEKRILGIVLAVLAGLGGLAVVQFILGAAVFTAMQQARPTLTPAEKIIYASVIQIEDLPRGWRSGDVRIESVPGAEGRFFIFHGTNDPDLTWINVSETLLVFESIELAKRNYSEQIVKSFPPSAADAWKHIPELEFPHHADEMKIACLPGYINREHFFACGAVARYQNVVVEMLGNVFDNRWLKMSDFRAVLEAMDRRIVAALNQTR